jgi:aldehyde dehydrogenase (NAD+)
MTNRTTGTDKTTSVKTPPQLFIDGEFHIADKAEPVLEAATGELLGDGASATEADIDAAVAAARAALPEWRGASPDHRAAVLKAFAAALHQRAASTSELVSRENGMPMSLSGGANGLFPAALLGYYAKLITRTPIEEIRPSATGHTIVRREPVGVVAAIVPWNYPQALAAFKFAPALAAGCTVVLKASPETALDAMVFAEAAQQAGIPAGVFNVVPGAADASAHLVSHPGVDKVSFTGSTSVGRIIGEVCGRLLRPVTLELGGKSAAIILDDADLDATMRGLRSVSFINNGQTCFLGSRILAPRSRYREIVDALADLVNTLTVGDPLDKATDIGPVVSARQRERVLGYIEAGKNSGAKLVVGGGVPRNQPRGWFVSPTVFADVDNSDRIAQEEIFGPVLAVIPYDSDEHAVGLANDSEFGLAGSVWSTDVARATEVAREIRTGTVGINDYQLDINAPFGGVKASGIGRELGPEGLDEFFNLKSIYRTGPADA